MSRRPRWYISFATSAGFRGATVVESGDEKSALGEATLRGLNPGGEAAIWQLPDNQYDAPDTLRMLNRLSGPAEMIANGGVRLRDMPPEVRTAFKHESVCVCGHCNRMRRHEDRIN